MNFHGIELGPELSLIGLRYSLRKKVGKQPDVVIEKIAIKHVFQSQVRTVVVEGNLSLVWNIDEISEKITPGIAAKRRLRNFVDK